MNTTPKAKSVFIGSLRNNPDLDKWIVIEPDGVIQIQSGKIEIGQGLRTALAMVAAEELDIDLSRVRMQMADTELTADEQVTSGSKSMESSATALRYAAAECRAIMLAKAAENMGVDVDSLIVEDGTIKSPATNAQTTYWDVMGGEKFGQKATGTVSPKPASAHRIVGTEPERVDIPWRVFGPGEGIGDALFMHDMERPNMLHGRIIRPTHQGSRLESVDPSALEAMPGVVKIVKNGSFLGLIAEREDQAIKAAEALAEAANWTAGEPLPNEEQIYDWMVSQDTIDNGVIDGAHIKDAPVEAPPPKNAALTLEGMYGKPYILHGAMGPACAIAQFKGDALTLWTHSQGVFPLRRALAPVLELKEANLHGIHRDGAGCYGHNSADDVALDAALLAREADGRPVRVQWTRKDEHRWEPFGTAMVCGARASLDADGQIIDWRFDIWSGMHGNRPKFHKEQTALLAASHMDTHWKPQPFIAAVADEAGEHRNASPGYDLPVCNIAKHFVANHPFRTSSLRGLGAFANVFAIESMMDELAHASGQDTVAFRLRHLSDPRARAVLEETAGAIKWDPKSWTPGNAQGIAYARYKNFAAYCAVAVDITIDEATGVITVNHAVVAGDAGEAVAPNGIKAQLEGGVIQATSWTLKERVRFDPGSITSTDWETYPILSFRESPEVDAIVISKKGDPFLGVGEASQSPTAGAIANAVFNATGARLREMPFTPERVRAMLVEAGKR